MKTLSYVLHDMYLKKALDNAQQSTEDDGVEGYLLGEL